MQFFRPLRPAILVAAAVLAACHPAFQPRQFGSDLSRLYRASMEQLQKHRWESAIAGFERLTIELPARDSLLPLSIFHLAEAHAGRKEYLLAAQSYTRVAESFPLDTLADEALFRAGQSYSEMWRKPSLDPQYGETARTTYQTLLQLYPQSPLAAETQRELDRLAEMFARKTYENGMFYFRRKAYESSIIYFTSVVDQYPSTDAAHDALLQLVDAYRRINYRSDVEETCATLHQKYPGDGEVRDECGPPPAAPATAVTPGR